KEVHDQDRGRRENPNSAGACRMKRALFFLLLSAFALLSRQAFSHELTIAEMELRESTRGEFLRAWTASEKLPSEEINVHWPEGCRAEEAAVHCGPQGLRGELSIDGVGQTYSAVMVKVFWLDGQSRVYTLTSAQPKV